MSLQYIVTKLHEEMMFNNNKKLEQFDWLAEQIFFVDEFIFKRKNVSYDSVSLKINKENILVKMAFEIKFTKKKFSTHHKAPYKNKQNLFFLS